MFKWVKRRKKIGLGGDMKGGEVVPRVTKTKDDDIVCPVLSRKKLDNRISIIKEKIAQIEASSDKRQLNHWKTKLEQTQWLREYYFGRN